jgi:hypothetical protein
MLGMYEGSYFEGIATRNKSWFQCSSYSDLTFLTPAKAPGQESGMKFLEKKLLLQFSLHLSDFWCRRSDQKIQSSIKTISFTRYFQDCPMKRREFQAETVSQLLQFTWTIRCVIMGTRSLRNLPREILNELHTHLILQT